MKTQKITSCTSQLLSAKGCGITKKAVFVSVTEALAGRGVDIATTTPLIDIARGFWFVDDHKINQCELLVAVDKGIIRGVWEIDTTFRWAQMTKNAIPTRNVRRVVVVPGRKYCKLTNEVLQGLKGRKSSSIGIRMYGPVRYNF